jgi:tetratricopeptide (TPR) repeat protein
MLPQRPRYRLALAALLATLACGRAPEPARVLVLGLDGMDPQTLDLLIQEGKLPSFARLRKDGAYAPMYVEPPLLSPVVWTTLATGKKPDEHGIGHFTAVDADGEEIPVTSQMRKVKALWNLFSERGKTVGVVGWWATWPAETVTGTVISDHTCYHFLSDQASAGARGTDGLVHPPTETAQVLARVRRPTDIGAAELAPFARVAADELDQPFRFEDELSHLRWALATAFTYRDLGLEVWRSRKPELQLTYIEGTDTTAHLFGHLFRQQPLAGELARQQERFGGTVEAVYALADRIVGEHLAALDARSTLVVVSDHGFELGTLPTDPSKLRDMRRVSERFHRDHGILYLYGHGIRPGTRLREPTTLDLAPTVLALAGLPAGQDMPGRVLEEAFDGEVAVPARIATWETGAPAPRAAAGTGADKKVDQAVIEKLKSLGYLGGAESTGSTGPRSAGGDRNLAFLALRERRYDEAGETFARLIAENPRDAALYTGLASALAGLGRRADALEQFEAALALDPIFVPAYHNRGIYYERLGETEAAIADFRTALRYDAAYEPSRRALERLGASVVERVARTPAEQEAAGLLAQASEAMRRGDYMGAATLLERAQRLTPDVAAIYQQQANVAYLAGDRAAAITALEKALALEPDNALFRRNLQRLRQRP